MYRSKATAYALLAASEIANQAKGVPGPAVMAGEIAKTYELPTAYAAKIMSQLVKAQILRSDRGPLGGFSLRRPSNKITLLEIFEAAQGPIGDGEMPDIPGPLRRTVVGVLSQFTARIKKMMDNVTLADLMKK